MSYDLLIGRDDITAIRADIDAVLDGFLAEKSAVSRNSHLPALVVVLREFLNDGKRLRPVLCMAGWQAGGGHGEWSGALALAASLEMFHTFALIHDDVMDGSDTRRGRPTVHRLLAGRWPLPQESERARWFGTSSAILLGDLALVWADELLHQAGLSERQRTAVQPVLAAMRTELMLGQYLDLLATGRLDDDVEAALSVVRYKTAKYTVERPLQLGAALAGAPKSALAACAAFGIPLGEAFQLRDDLLGVFGCPEETGKSRLDDLRSGKRTTLMALALRAADPAQVARLTELVGSPGLDERDAAQVRDILTVTGARATVEHMITGKRRQALEALAQAPFASGTDETLRTLADSLVSRTC